MNEMTSLSCRCGSKFAPPEPDDNTDSNIGQLKKLSKANVNATSQRSSSSLLHPKLRRALEEFYSPFNRQLVELLQDKRFDWGY